MKGHVKLCGAELIEVPAVPFKDPNNYVHQRNGKQQNSLLASQRRPLRQSWDNTSNRLGHFHQPDRNMGANRRQGHGFTCAMGTGGTLAGISMLKKS